MSVPAVFLDRDGTLIEDVGYLADPGRVRLLPGAGEALRRLSELGHRLVVVSNQSGIARGKFGENSLALVHARLEQMLKKEGAALDGAYYCPYLDGPEASVEAFRRDSDLRKPKPGMLLQAAEELKIDLAKSWMIGDTARDVEAGHRAGCRTIWLCHNGARYPAEAVPPDHTVRNLREAAKLIEAHSPAQPTVLEKERERKPESATAAAGKTPRPPTKGVVADPAPERDAVAPPKPLTTGPRADSQGGSSTDDAATWLERIYALLERTIRERRHQDFSVLRLFGALLQMFAIVAAGWGAVALLNDESAPATARFALACFLQLASVSAFAIDRFR